MIVIKGYNKELEKFAEVQIWDDGTIIKEDWEHIEPGSVKLYTGRMDSNRNMLFQDDEIVNELNGKHAFIRYGEHELSGLDNDIQTIGFYIETMEHETMPLTFAEEISKVMRER